MKPNLIDHVKSDISDFLEKHLKELLFNERDFQMHLAMYLKDTGKYDDVDLEYYVPHEELQAYPWDTEIRLDIVVMKDNEYLPIELKYKTKKVERALKRFDEQLNAKYIIMKNQSAQDLGMYDFWKDVRRVELVRERFSNVKNGLAVFMTNDKSYLKSGGIQSNYYLFNMAEGPHGKEKEWKKKEAAIAQKRPGFNVEKEYAIKWNTTDIENIDFYFCIVEI